MMRYRLDKDPDTGRPCMVMDPEGPWCCAGEVDREMERMRKEIADATRANDRGTVSEGDGT